MRAIRSAVPSLLLLSLLCTPLVAQNRAHADEAADKQTTTTTVKTEAGGHELQPEVVPDSTTDGTVRAGGKDVAYTAVAGLLTVGSSDSDDAKLTLDGRWMRDAVEDLPNKPSERPATARMFYTAYFAKGVDTRTRPVMFFYNGGPGSATMYLRMASFGPERVELEDVAHPYGGPYKIVPNADSLLDVADLVFIDAPGTGYSRVEGKDAGKAFYGVDGDAAAFDRFIRRFLTKFDRWTSPRFLFGESYGTTRDAVLSAKLQASGVDLNGIVFLSQILSFTSSADGSDGSPGTENGFFLALPSFAATAWYHHRVPNQPAELEPFLRTVEQYALTDYASALMEGASLDETRKAAVAAKLESFTGIPAALWIKANLRLTGGEFAQNLQLPGDITTGRLDSRFEGPALDPLGREAGYDPFTESVESAILAAQNQYAHTALKFGRDMTYLPSAREPGWHWDMTHNPPGRGGNRGALNVIPDLAYTMTVNPRMHVLLMGGYFDLGTLYFGAEYEMRHLPIPAELQKNISYQFFPTGHMVYVNPDARKAMHDRTAEFVRENENAAK